MKIRVRVNFKNSDFSFSLIYSFSNSLYIFFVFNFPLYLKVEFINSENYHFSTKKSSRLKRLVVIGGQVFINLFLIFIFKFVLRLQIVVKMISVNLLTKITKLWKVLCTFLITQKEVLN